MKRGSDSLLEHGDVAQLGERCLRKAEVGSSSLLVSTRNFKGLGKCLTPFLLAGTRGRVHRLSIAAAYQNHHNPFQTNNVYI